MSSNTTTDEDLETALNGGENVGIREVLRELLSSSRRQVRMLETLTEEQVRQGSALILLERRVSTLETERRMTSLADANGALAAKAAGDFARDRAAAHAAELAQAKWKNFRAILAFVAALVGIAAGFAKSELHHPPKQEQTP
jgi:hypothetical protein